MALRMGDLVTRSGLSTRTIRRWIADGSLRAKKDEKGQYAFTEEHVTQVLRKVNPSYSPIDRLVLSLSNNKGGVGKTASAINLAREFSEFYSVLLVDLDPQANATSATVDNPDQRSFLNHLADGTPLEELIIPGEHFDVLPSHISFEMAEIKHADPDPQSVLSLKRALDEVNKYQIILIDTLPSLGVLQRIALCAADGVLVPVQASSFAIEGVYNLDMLIQDMNHEYGVATKIVGVVMTMFDQRVSMSHLVKEQLTNAYGKISYDTVIRRNTAIDEAMTLRMPVRDFAPRSFGAIDYKSLTWEVVRNVT